MKLFTHKHYAKIIASQGVSEKRERDEFLIDIMFINFFLNLSAYNYLKSFKKTFFPK